MNEQAKAWGVLATMCFAPTSLEMSLAHHSLNEVLDEAAASSRPTVPPPSFVVDFGGGNVVQASSILA